MEILTTGHGLLEGPVIDSAGGLIFSDVTLGGVKRLDPSGTVETIVPGRRGIGGLALHVNGGLVLSGRNVAFKAPGRETVVLLGDDPEHDILGFNDLTTDAVGRVYVGSLAFRAIAGQEAKPGALHLLDLDGSTRVVSSGILVTNGLGFSPDGRRLYHCDSVPQLVWVYDVDSDGELQDRRVFARIEGGIPDGLVVSADGAVWVAVYQGGHIVIFEPDGSVRSRIEAPASTVTTLCFAGDDGRDLYVLTGPSGAPSDVGGGVYRTRVDVPGLPVTPACVAVPR
ncbi:MAG: hypothetical protein EPO21_04570 [Chloroflexota bacterium]|nr:MAG: hypothetical protein EPO21_04570 [Chloroflexota bacterium]